MSRVCGIAGFLDFDGGNADSMRELATRMVATLTHRNHLAGENHEAQLWTTLMFHSWKAAQ